MRAVSVCLSLLGLAVSSVGGCSSDRVFADRGPDSGAPSSGGADAGSEGAGASGPGTGGGGVGAGGGASGSSGASGSGGGDATVPTGGDAAVEDGGTPPDGSAPDDGAAADADLEGGQPPPDAVIQGPTVVATSPASGASQVMDEPLVITFSTPMDQATVEALFPGASFDWNAEGTEVTIDTQWPFDDTPTAHTVVLPTSVRDLDGNPLQEETEITFVLAALVNRSIGRYADLTGSSDEGAGTNFTFLYAGDSSTDVMTYGGFSFDISSLPPRDTILALRSAVIQVQVTRIDGNPNNLAMGDFLLDHIEFPAQHRVDNPAAILQEGFAVLYEGGSMVTGAAANVVSVQDQLDVSWGAGSTYLQFRIHPVNVSVNGTADRIFMRRIANENNTVIDPGVTEPDADNRLLLTVEYFD